MKLKFLFFFRGEAQEKICPNNIKILIARQQSFQPDRYTRKPLSRRFRAHCPLGKLQGEKTNGRRRWSIALSLSEFRDVASKARGEFTWHLGNRAEFHELRNKRVPPFTQEQLCDAQNAKWMLALKSLLQRGGKMSADPVYCDDEEQRIRFAHYLAL